MPSFLGREYISTITFTNNYSSEVASNATNGNTADMLLLQTTVEASFGTMKRLKIKLLKSLVTLSTGTFMVITEIV